MATKQVTQQHAVGAQIQINQGSGRFTIGVVQAFGEYIRPDGYVGFGYTILATGGVNVFGQPAAGSTHYVKPAHVSAH